MLISFKPRILTYYKIISETFFITSSFRVFVLVYVCVSDELLKGGNREGNEGVVNANMHKQAAY